MSVSLSYFLLNAYNVYFNVFGDSSGYCHHVMVHSSKGHRVRLLRLFALYLSVILHLNHLSVGFIIVHGSQSCANLYHLFVVLLLLSSTIKSQLNQN